MIVTLIVAAEFGFWAVLAAGLATRYLLRRPRLGAGLLLLLPVIDVLLLTATAVDLRRGADPSAAHGIAALYLGFTVAYGHYTVRWADGHAAHRLAGAPRPAKPPRYGAARARHEWRIWSMTLLAVAIALGVLEAMIQYVDDADRTESLRGTQQTALRALGIHAIVAATYSIWPRRAPAPGTESPSAPAETREISGRGR
ncbi:hypothetical protein RM780_09310 [Streptomyces sp. DSM 44917]|uniref:Integral membrane protein n=1 Tax=Streptomyces boetiae TaxID=3075541 RepID=A0ABU2L6H2_9ACTN|nr:hypothetical protein [Streptomyces sp. DSM 44917]MDT0307159.1 hypothetical protein [Streptomyces sp. DSM 44917]